MRFTNPKIAVCSANCDSITCSSRYKLNCFHKFVTFEKKYVFCFIIQIAEKTD